MSAVILDVLGGVFSLVQLVIDSSLQGDWSGITGNPAKFGLANLSMVADVIFVVQRYILYWPGAKCQKKWNGLEDETSDERDPLLGNVDRIDGIHRE